MFRQGDIHTETDVVYRDDMQTLTLTNRNLQCVQEPSVGMFVPYENEQQVKTSMTCCMLFYVSFISLVFNGFFSFALNRLIIMCSCMRLCVDLSSRHPGCLVFQCDRLSVTNHHTLLHSQYRYKHNFTADSKAELSTLINVHIINTEIN